MTIKEVELKTGLTRANIRYYEDQGFFTAGRGENGYRNYSDENIDTLLKIKLLRQLGFSLEEIHELQNGERSLDQALEQREAGLTGEIQALNQALDLCRTIRADGADFYTLDAQRYLDRLARAETVIEKDRDPVRIFPWRRLFARELDYVLYHALLAFALQLFARMNYLRVSENGGQTFLLNIGALVVMLGTETLLLTLTGTTPGKWLLGLKIVREDGSRLSFEEAGQRTIYVVLFYGFAQVLLGSRVLLFGIGGGAMLTWACWQVYHEQSLPWETYPQLYLEGSTRERAFWDNRRNYLRVAGYAAAWAACIGLMMGGHFLAAMPSHRGAELTAEEFVENYNQYMAFARGESNLTKYLTLNGTFEEREQVGGGYVINVFGDSPVPDGSFFFRQGGGRVSKVVFTREYEGSGPITAEQNYGVGIPYDEIYASMRAYLWRRLGSKGIDALYQELVNQGGNYHAALGGVQIDCEMRFEGYHPFWEGSLFATEGETQSYYVEFVMELTE